MKADRFRVDPAILPLLPPEERAKFDDDGYAVEAVQVRPRAFARTTPIPIMIHARPFPEQLDQDGRRAWAKRNLGDMADAPAVDGRPEA